MSRLMSVAFTEQAVVERRKTVTRRKGWWQDKHGHQILKPGDRLTLCRKVMGRKPGEPLVRLAEVEVVSVNRETLNLCARPGEMEREGFPGMDPAHFVGEFFIAAQGIGPNDYVTRIEWRYLDGENGASERRVPCDPPCAHCSPTECWADVDAGRPA